MEAIEKGGRVIVETRVRHFSRVSAPVAEKGHGPLASPSQNGCLPSGRSLDARVGRSPSRSQSWAPSIVVASWATRVIGRVNGRELTVFRTEDLGGAPGARRQSAGQEQKDDRKRRVLNELAVPMEATIRRR